MRGQAQGVRKTHVDECIRGQLKTADAEAKCDPNAIQEGGPASEKDQE